MSLSKVSTTTASNVATVDITGITTDDNYMLTITNLVPATDNLVPATDNAQLRGRVLKSGSAQTGASYDYASEEIKAHTAFGAFNSSSDYDHISTEWAFKNNGNNLYGNTGGGVHTVVSASNGIQFYFSTGNISTGTFTLYKITGA